jgi:hypothetical protein
MTQGYKPPSSVEPVLDSIESLLAHPRTQTITDSFIGKTFMCRLPGGQLYFDSNLELDTDGSAFSDHAFDPKGRPDTTARDARGELSGCRQD